MTQEFFEWYMTEAAVSLFRLSSILGRDIEATGQSMHVVDSWMSESIAAEPFVAPAAPVPIVVEAKGIRMEIPGDSFIITPIGWTAIFDVGIAFALTLMKKCATLEWRSVRPKGKSRKVFDVDTSLPALYGFNAKLVHLQPQRIAHVVARKYVTGGGNRGQLSHALHVWEEDCLV